MVIAHDHMGNLPRPVKEKAYLAVEFPGERGYGAEEILGRDEGRWNPPAVELGEPFYLRGLEALGGAVEGADVSLLSAKLLGANPPFKRVEKAGPGVCLKGGGEFPYPLLPAGGAREFLRGF
jgi:hypothetical protein